MTVLTPNLLHKLFTHDVTRLPLTAELFRYVRNKDVYDLEARCRIARTNEGTVYLGIRDIPTQHDMEGSSFAVVIVWDAVSEKFIVRDRTTDVESVVDGPLANRFKAVDLDIAKPPQRHLGYSVYHVKNGGVRYCPALELAMIEEMNVDGREYQNIVRWVQRGEPDVREFYILRHKDRCA